jgi:hypothetical protein
MICHLHNDVHIIRLRLHSAGDILDNDKRKGKNTYIERVINQILSNTRKHVQAREDILHMIKNIGLDLVRPYRVQRREKNTPGIFSICGS